MFPIRDNIPASRFPAAMLFLIVVCVWIFWREVTMPRELLEAFVFGYGLVPARDWPFSDAAPLAGPLYDPFADAWYGVWPEGLGPGAGGGIGASFLPYFTTMFLHGGWMHLISNMWSLWLFGDNVEDKMGPSRFLAFFVFCGLAASVTHAALNPESAVPVVGASGAISGIMGAYLVLFPRARLKMLFLFVFYPVFFEIPATVFLLIWFVGQLLSGTMALSVAAVESGSAQGVAFWAHIGGFVAGILSLPVFLRRKR